MLKTDRTEDVYPFIWNVVAEREALPTEEQIIEAPHMPKEEVAWRAQVLRYKGWLERRILLPTACCAWWTEHLQARWGYQAMRQS